MNTGRSIIMVLYRDGFFIILPIAILVLAMPWITTIISYHNELFFEDTLIDIEQDEDVVGSQYLPIQYDTYKTILESLNIVEEKNINPKQIQKQLNYQPVTELEKAVGYRQVYYEPIHEEPVQKIEKPIDKSEEYYNTLFNIYSLTSIEVMVVIIAIDTLIFAILSGFLVSYIQNVANVVKIGNMEKNAKRLRKMGVDEFVKMTNAKLIGCSSRGNSLYSSHNIIKGQLVHFLVYQDLSTDRKYIKYVPQTIYDPDEAQAWSLSMSLERYQKMTIEA